MSRVTAGESVGNGSDTVIQAIGDIEGLVLAKGDSGWSNDQRRWVGSLGKARANDRRPISFGRSLPLVRNLQINTYNRPFIDDFTVCRHRPIQNVRDKESCGGIMVR